MDLDEYLTKHLPELPEEATSRLIRQYGLSEEIALIITSDRPGIAMFEEAVEACKGYLRSLGDQAKGKNGGGDDQQKHVKVISVTVANWLCNDLYALVKESATTRISEGVSSIDVGRKGINENDINDNEDNDDGGLNHPISMEYSKVDAQRLGEMLALVLNGAVSTTHGKRLLRIMYEEEQEEGIESSVGGSDTRCRHPLDIAESRGWKVISDPVELKVIVSSVVSDPSNQSQLEQYRKGGKHVRKIFKFFVGKIMAVSKGNAHPKIMKHVLTEFLDEEASVDKV